MKKRMLVKSGLEVSAIGLDMTDHGQIAQVVSQAESRFGGIDVLVNNAGHGYRAAMEEADEAEVDKLFATNFLDPVTLMKTVLPGVRQRRGGTIMNVSSIAACNTGPGSGYYATTKCALEGLSNGLRKEVGPLGIHVMVVEPGEFRTDFAGRSLRQARVALADYVETVGRRRIEHDITDGHQRGDPARGAHLIIKAVESSDPPSLLLLGSDAVQVVNTALDEDRAQVAAWKENSVVTDFPT